MVLTMKIWPAFDDSGDLPVGIHRATVDDVVEHFGKGSLQRRMVAERLQRIYSLVLDTQHVHRFIIFGSFVTSKPDPGDIDIFLLMKDTFDVRDISGESRILFGHMAAQNYEGASIFWIRRLAALGGEDGAIEHWQIRRDGRRRGIVEVLIDDWQ